MKTKEELEKEISLLQERVEANKTMSEGYTDDLTKLQKQLEDINKPQLTPLQFDLIQEAIQAGIGNFDFDDEGNYDKEFGINYDGKVHLENLDFTSSQELLEAIVEKVNKLFTEAECPND